MGVIPVGRLTRARKKIIVFDQWADPQGWRRRIEGALEDLGHLANITDLPLALYHLPHTSFFVHWSQRLKNWRFAVLDLAMKLFPMTIEKVLTAFIHDNSKQPGAAVGTKKQTRDQHFKLNAVRVVRLVRSSPQKAGHHSQTAVEDVEALLRHEGLRRQDAGAIELRRIRVQLMKPTACLFEVGGTLTRAESRSDWDL